MGCCGDEEEQKSKTLGFVRAKDRSCTDILFLLLFIASFAATGFLIWRAAADGGSPYDATHGQDYSGQTCSSDLGRKFAAWPIIPLVNETTTYSDAQYYFAIKVCVESCEETNNPANKWFLEPYESFKLWRYCIPKNLGSKQIDFHNQPSFHNATDEVIQLFSDLYATWWIILAAAGFAVFTGLIYTKLMSIKFIRTLLVWGVILFILAASSVISWLLLDWSKHATTTPLDTIDRKQTANVLGWIMVGITIFLFLCVFFLRSRINYALRVIGSTSSALSQMQLVFLYPIIPIFFACIYFAYWVWGALYLFTVNDLTFHPIPPVYDNIQGFAELTNKTFAVHEWNQDYKYFFVYWFFHLLWVNQFFTYAAFITIAGAMGQWFFAKPRGTSNSKKERGGDEGQLPYFPIFSSAIRTIRFHIGTVAFASLIIAIFQFIRAVITYIQTKTKGKDNRLIRCILCCLKCVLWCVQKCLDYVSRNALVICAISGDNFCKSACTAFGLLTSNILRVVAFNVVSTFVLFIGRLFISLITTCCASILIIRYYQGDRADDINSPILPIIVIFILSWFVASTFIRIYDVSLECMFLCYLSDKDGKFTPKKIHKTFQMTEERHRKLQELEEAQLEVKRKERELYREQYETKKDKKDKKEKKDKNNSSYNPPPSSPTSVDVNNPYAQ